jgi:hypothetical protein
MEQRLEAALRPGPDGAKDVSRLNGSSGAVEPARLAASDGKAPRTDVRPGASKGGYDSLEAEMASLLGRPATKL